MAYGTDEGLIEYLSAMGMELPITADPAVVRQIGSNYIDAAYEWRLACSRRTEGFEQDLAWPRVGHYVNGQSVPADLIPQPWIHASYRAAYLTAVTPGWATTSTDATRQVKRQKVDAIEREFFSGSEAAGSDVAPGMPSDSIINGMLASWLCPIGKRSINSLFRVI